MIDERLLGWPPPILKGRLLITGSGLPQRPQRCKFFCGRTIHGLGSEIGRSSQNFGVCRYRFVVEKDLTYFVRFENKIVLFSGTFR